MATLLLRLAGPMQSWGTQSRFSVRDTGLEPSKSGVIGLLCAALGRERSMPIDDLAGLQMAVRVDREGSMKCDFHTALDVVKAYGKRPPHPKHPRYTVTSSRYYLADADFLVRLESNAELLRDLHSALQHLVWQLYLGRKSFLPSRPVWVRDGLKDASLMNALADQPWVRRNVWERPPDRLRIVREALPDETNEVRCDQPLTFDISSRNLGGHCTLRHVKTDWVELTQEMIVEEDPCFSPA